jgi:hypothetical protein
MWNLAAGMSIFTLARRMGTNVQMIDATYGHLAQDAENQPRRTTPNGGRGHDVGTNANEPDGCDGAEA